VSDVVLINDQTALVPAQAAIATAPDQRFVWLRQQGATPLVTEQVLAALFDTNFVATSH
jgi:hypothetical protein